MKHRCILAAAMAAATTMAPAASAQVVLTFEGVGDFNPVDDFYNGGAGGNLGISFVNGLGLVDVDVGGSGNFANEPSGSTVLLLRNASLTTMNVAAGFDTGFSFFYSSSDPALVSVYSGLNGTGTLLASLPLIAQHTTNCSGDPDGTFCNWSPVGVSFAGVAQSVQFGGVDFSVIFDNVTLGASTPGGGAVPEPGTWALMITGFGAVGYAMRRRKRVSFTTQTA